MSEGKANRQANEKPHIRRELFPETSNHQGNVPQSWPVALSSQVSAPPTYYWQNLQHLPLHTHAQQVPVYPANTGEMYLESSNMYQMEPQMLTPAPPFMWSPHPLPYDPYMMSNYMYPQIQERATLAPPQVAATARNRNLNNTQIYISSKGETHFEIECIYDTLVRYLPHVANVACKRNNVELNGMTITSFPLRRLRHMLLTLFHKGFAVISTTRVDDDFEYYINRHPEAP